MTIHMTKEVENLKKMLLSLSAVVEKHVGLAVKSIEDRDSALAKKVIEDDNEIDEAEVEVEEECLKICNYSAKKMREIEKST